MEVDIVDMSTKEVLELYTRALTLGVEVDLSELNILIEDDEIFLLGLDNSLVSLNKEYRVMKCITSIDSCSMMRIDINKFICNENLKFIYAYSFAHSNIKEFKLNSNVLLFDKVFFGSKIESINSDKIVYLGDSTFANTRNLKKLDLSNCTTIGNNCFSDSDIETLVLNSSLDLSNVRVGKVFYGMNQLQEVIILGSNNKLSEYFLSKGIKVSNI